MKIMVTGSKGYCGQGIVQALVEHGHKVIGFDRSIPKDYRETENYKICLGDLTNFASFFPVMKGCEAIIHSAIFTGRKMGDDLPQPFLSDIKLDYSNIKAFDVTDTGTIHLFEAARKTGIDKICLVSSGAVIYHHIVDSKNETKYLKNKVTAKSTPALRGFYGLTKLIQEEIGQFYAQVYGMSVSSMRAWWVVDGKRFINKLGEDLNHDSHPLSPEGLVDRVDLGDACRLAVEKGFPGFRVYYPMSAPGCETYFDVKPLKEELGWQPRYGFEELAA